MGQTTRPARFLHGIGFNDDIGEMLVDLLAPEQELPDVAFAAVRPAERLRKGAVHHFHTRIHRTIVQEVAKLAVGLRVFAAQIVPGSRLDIERDFPLRNDTHRIEDVAPGSGGHVAARTAMVAIHVVKGRRGAGLWRLGRCLVSYLRHDQRRTQSFCKLAPVHTVRTPPWR